MKKHLPVILSILILFSFFSCSTVKTIQEIKESDPNFISGKKQHNDAIQLFRTMENVDDNNHKGMIDLKNKFYESNTKLYTFFKQHPDDEETILMLAKNYYYLAYLEVNIGDNIQQMESNLLYARDYYTKIAAKHPDMEDMLNIVRQAINNRKNPPKVEAANGGIDAKRIAVCIIKQIPWAGIVWDACELVTMYRAEIISIIANGFQKGEFMDFYDKKLSKELKSRALKAGKKVNIVLSAISFWDCLHDQVPAVKGN